MDLFSKNTKGYTAPFWIYKRLQIAHPREYFMFSISYGYGFLLRKLRIKYPETVTGSTVQSERLKLEFFDNANYTARQPVPFALDFISTPGFDGATVHAAPSPADSTAFNVNMSAKPFPKSSGILNFLYKYGDTLRIDITEQIHDPISGLWSPNYIDLLLQGYYVPDLTQAQYGEK